MGLNISKKFECILHPKFSFKSFSSFWFISQMSQRFILLFTYFDPEPLA